MRPWLLLVVAASIGACKGAAPACPAGAPPIVAVAPVARVPSAPNANAKAKANDDDDPEAYASTSPCWARGKPTALPRPPDAHPFCGAFDPRELARVEARLRRELTAPSTPSKLVVDFGCDAAVGRLAEVDYEDGSGHGGTLRIARFVDAGASVSVRVIDSSHYFGKAIAIRSGYVDRASFLATIERSRVAMLARPHFLALRSSSGLGGLSGSWSSNDFHLRLSIVDDEGHVTDQGFTGYESSDEAPRFLPMQMATDPLDELLRRTPLAETPITDDDRAFFTARFLATMNGAPYWWVMERYVALAATLGTIDAVPALVAVAQGRGDGASKDRAREVAIDAVAALTGFDARKGPGDADGGARTTDQAAAALASACVP